MGIFSKSKEKGELMLVFDIRSSSVGGALIEVQKSGVPTIVLSIREPIILEKAVDVDRFLFSTIKPLDIVAKKILAAGIGAPKRVFCTLFSPWYVSQTRIISFKKDKSFVFTSALADELIKKETLVFQEEHLANYVKTGHKIRFIELKCIKTTLNGYEIQNPLDQKAKELEITIFISMSPEQVLSSIEGIIKKYFHHQNIKFSSFAMSSFAVVRNISTNQDNFLLIDVGGEMTDIFMMKKNTLRESISFPLGHHFFVRGIASALSCALDEAESLLSLLKDGHAETSTEKRLEPIVKELKKKWLEKFQESLANFSKDISIPSTIYLSADTDFMDFFGKIIETEQFNQYTFTESKFKIIFLNTETLHGLVEFEKNTLRDPFNIINSVYINHFLIYPTSINQA